MTKIQGKQKVKKKTKCLQELHLMSSYQAAVKCYEENRPKGGEKNLLVYSSDRTMKQHSVLGATCSFKSGVSICVI